ncbi:unnamed protein product [Microthlaspi erraticum]|uniref:F-box associated beta-propeller type 1 domain-containing protein n=1 Tax=Microthlaspi erraticum TaxID=1685480 RepID=A0A6D2HNS0_9BRAS|nr:unnamed protein product [Microthlaspi erraticum]
MTTEFDLPRDLMEKEILPRVPITSLRAVRSTCKDREASSKNQILGKAAGATKQLLGFMMIDYKVCSLKFDLHDAMRDNEELVIIINQENLVDHVEISQIIHCDGLLLCVIKDNKGLVVWNPYLGQIKCIQPREKFDSFDVYALGYDNNRNHKILRIIFDHYYRVLGYEIYDFSFGSWKDVVYVTHDWDIWFHQPGASLKGNTYFFVQERGTKDLNTYAQDKRKKNLEEYLLCFDFTTEKFGPRLPLPHDKDNVSLSCVGDEELAVLCQTWGTSHVIEIWVTDKIDPNAVSWRNYLELLDSGIQVDIYGGSFFIDEENKAAVIFDIGEPEPNQTCRYRTVRIITQDGLFASGNMGEAPNFGTPHESGYVDEKYCFPLVCSSYVPSLVQL